jgi:inner membrane protein
MVRSEWRKASGEWQKILSKLGPFAIRYLPLRARSALPVVTAVDLLLGSRPLPLAVRGVLDETAHAATALLLLGALRPRADDAALLAATAGAVLLDADHIPQVLGWNVITRDPEEERPYPHALVTVAATLALATLAPARPRRLLSWAAFGMATHLFRDVATGGAPLLWPRSVRSVRIPYGVYAATLAAASWRLRRLSAARRY